MSLAYQLAELAGGEKKKKQQIFALGEYLNSAGESYHNQSCHKVPLPEDIW